MSVKLELVTWRDSHFELEDGPAPKDFLMRTAGWTRRKGRWLVIVSELAPKGSGKVDRGVTRVPIENIVKRKRLR